MLNSVNTNAGAMFALQALNATNVELEQTQNRITTGKKVATPKDNGATWAIAQAQRAEVVALGAVKDSLDRGISGVSVALSAGETVSDLLVQMKEKVLAASDKTLTVTARRALNEDFKSLRDQISKTIENAEFNGVNLLKTGAVDVEFLANAAASSRLTVKAEIMALGGTIVTVGATASFATATIASGFITTVNASIENVSAALARLGTKARSLEMHSLFVTKLSDGLTAGIGNLIDADLAKESAKLQALQTRQQLGVQALSIANQAPTILSQLFRN
jgi:flagellin